MQSLASQVNDVWNEGSEGVRKQAIPARDFMIYRIPAHELTTAEEEEMSSFGKETSGVMESFEKEGGVWVGCGENKEWLGVDKSS
jgi:ribonuclease Z